MKKFIVILFAFLFLSCADMTTAQKQDMVKNAIELLRIGMTIAQATGIMGTPANFYEVRAVDVQRYEYPDGVLIFRDGKLSEIKKRIK